MSKDEPQRQIYVLQVRQQQCLLETGSKASKRLLNVGRSNMRVFSLRARVVTSSPSAAAKFADDAPAYHAQTEHPNAHSLRAETYVEEIHTLSGAVILETIRNLQGERLPHLVAALTQSYSDKARMHQCHGSQIVVGWQMQLQA